MTRNKLASVKKLMQPYSFLSLALFVLIVMMVYPIIQVFYYSFFNNVISNPNPQFIGFENYKTILFDSVFQSSIFHTLYFTFQSVLFHFIIGMIFALLLNANINNKVRSSFRLIMVLPWLFTPTVIAIVWKLMLDPSGIVNYMLTSSNIINKNIQWFGNPKTAIHAVTLANIWAGYPFYMISILAGLQSVPKDQYEAAKIDGTNSKQNFWYITLPHLKPVLLSLSMLDFIWTMQVFPLIWVTTGGGPIHATEMMSTFTYKQTFFFYEFSLASTAAVIIFVISMLISLFYAIKQR